MADSNPPVFDYQKYQTPGVSTDILDQMAQSFFSAATATNWVTKLWSGVVLVVGFAYIWGRDKLVAQQEMLIKQQYELQESQGQGSEVNGQVPHQGEI